MALLEKLQTAAGSKKRLLAGLREWALRVDLPADFDYYTSDSELEQFAQYAIVRSLQDEIRLATFLQNAAACDCVDLLRLLISAGVLTADSARAYDNAMLCIAASRGSIGVLELFVELFGFSAEDVRRNDAEAIALAAENNRVSVLKLFARLCPRKDFRRRENAAFQRAVAGGALDAVVFFAQTLDFSATDVCAFYMGADRAALRTAIAADAANMLKIFAHVYHVSVDNFDALFCTAVRDGALKTLEFFADSLGFSAAKVRAVPEVVVLAAMQNARMLEIFVRKYALTPDDLRANNNAAFRAAVEHGNLTAALLLAEQLTTADLCARSNEALVFAVVRGNIPMLRLLIQKGAVSSAILRASCADPRFSASMTTPIRAELATYGLVDFEPRLPTQT